MLYDSLDSLYVVRVIEKGAKPKYYRLIGPILCSWLPYWETVDYFKYNIVLDNGVLYEKKTFKVNTKKFIKGEDIVDLVNEKVVVKKLPKLWIKDFARGVKIPEETLLRNLDLI